MPITFSPAPLLQTRFHESHIPITADLTPLNAFFIESITFLPLASHLAANPSTALESALPSDFSVLDVAAAVLGVSVAEADVSLLDSTLSLSKPAILRFAFSALSAMLLSAVDVVSALVAKSLAELLASARSVDTALPSPALPKIWSVKALNLSARTDTRPMRLLITFNTGLKAFIKP